MAAEKAKRIDFINKRLIEERRAEKKFSELDDAMREYQLFLKRFTSLTKTKIK